MEEDEEPVLMYCIICHQPMSMGIARDFNVSFTEPLVCMECAEEIRATVTILNGGFW